MTNKEKIATIEKDIATAEKYLSETKSKQAARAFMYEIARMRLEVSRLKAADRR